MSCQWSVSQPERGPCCRQLVMTGSMHGLGLLTVLILTSLCGGWASSTGPRPGSIIAEPLSTARHGSMRFHSSKSASYVAIELLLRQIVEECSKKEDTVLQIDAQGQLHVSPKLALDSPCPAMDIAFRGQERGVGMCTDAALYLLHMGPAGAEGQGARIIPLLSEADMAIYSAKCTQTTARMFMESIYHEWIAPKGAGGFHIMQVNSEHLFKVHEPHHKAMNIFLCKTRFCQRLVWRYTQQLLKIKAEVWYIGHTSSDVLVEGSTTLSSDSSSSSSASLPQQKGGKPIASPIHANFTRFLHVKGKSGLKHTKQLLECWAAHPEFPELTVIGQSDVEDPITQAVLQGRMKNVRLMPIPVQDQQQQKAVGRMALRLALAADKQEQQLEADVQAEGGSMPARQQPHSAAVVIAQQGLQVEPQQQQQSLSGSSAAATAQQEPAAGIVQQPAEQQPAKAAASALQTREFATAKAHVNELLGLLGQQPLAAATVSAARRQLLSGGGEHQQLAILMQLPPAASSNSHSSSRQQHLLSVSSRSSSGSSSDHDVSPEQIRFAAKTLMWKPPMLSKEQLISFEDVRQLQASIGIHICTSEREGFGHYLNEARAAGAVIISTDHPPMNELVHDGVSGVLVKPSRTGSYQEWQALAAYHDINAFLDPSDICAGVQRVLKMSLKQRQKLGIEARKQYLLDKSLFVHKVRTLRKVLHRRRLQNKDKQALQTDKK